MDGISGIGFEVAEIRFIRDAYSQGYEDFEFARREDIPMNAHSGVVVSYHIDGRTLYHEFCRRSEEGKIITEMVAEAFFKNPLEFALFKERLSLKPLGLQRSSTLLKLADLSKKDYEESMARAAKAIELK